MFQWPDSAGVFCNDGRGQGLKKLWKRSWVSNGLARGFAQTCRFLPKSDFEKLKRLFEFRI